MNYAIILSGGIGARMRTDGFPKQYIEIKKKPILIYTLEKFQTSPEVDQIILVAAQQWKKQITAWCTMYHITKLRSIAEPGESRQESILHGLDACMEDSVCDQDKVIIHDAVRPLVSGDLISTCFSALNEYEGCMPVLSISDTVYQSEDGENISKLLDRSTLFAGQAPEAFRLKRYAEINRATPKEELALVRGTTEIAYKNGLKICIIPGEDMNFKLTTPADLNRFRILMGGSNESI